MKKLTELAQEFIKASKALDREGRYSVVKEAFRAEITLDQLFQEVDRQLNK